MNLYDYRKSYLKNFIIKLQNRLNYLSVKSNKFSFRRLIVFLAGVIITISGFYISNSAGWILLALSVSGFAVTVHFHNMLLSRMKRMTNFLDIKKAHYSRMITDWQGIPVSGNPITPQENSLARDLDITGDKSLHQLLDISVSIEGSILLSEILLNTNPAKETILKNQKIVNELSRHHGFTDKFLLKAGLTSGKKLDCLKIIKFFLNLEDVSLPAWLFPVNFILILIFLILFILSQFELTGSLWIPVFIMYFFFYSMYQKRISKLFEETYDTERQLKKFTSLVLLISESRSLTVNSSDEFKEFLNPLKKEAPELLKRMQKYVQLILIRENPLLRLIINLVFPFDIFLYNRLSLIRSEIKEKIEVWFDVLNSLECYVSISNFAWLNPDYCFPEICTSEEGVFNAEKLGHPLLKREEKICNDFSLKKDREIIVITGSNMSGKSTFLKTAGINLCLAYAGAPVNAANLKISPFELFTCIKISDSVSDGISYFYAEVKKLRILLDELNENKDLMTFYLIDEIFKGTNNRERLQGSRAFIKELSKLKGSGLITTHDLELVSLSDEIKNITNLHFREEISDSKMIFDYKIHEGPCPTTNALKIMELSGLPVK